MENGKNGLIKKKKRRKELKVDRTKKKTKKKNRLIKRGWEEIKLDIKKRKI